ncbi:MAG TPA: OprD family outer membrane porin [Campylobacterales bacterium]|nr:OprD family outer membrane porin [Campylobacterales bacterium]
MNRLSACLFAMLCVGSLSADAATEYNGFTLSGEIISGYVEYDYASTLDSAAFATVLKVGLETPKVGGFYAKVMGGAVNDFGLSDLGVGKQRKSVIFRKKSDGSYSNYEILQELFVGYDSGAHSFKVGRNEFVSPMISKDDFYMFANSFETISYRNKSIENLAIDAGYIHKMAGVWDSRSDGSNFRSMSDASMVPALNKGEANNAGVYYGGLEYKKGVHSAKLWEYYAKELYNTVFASYDYTSKAGDVSYMAGLQYIDFSEVGKLSKTPTTIGVNVYSAQLEAKTTDGISLASSLTKFGKGDGEQYLLGAWGGYAYPTKGFIFHFHESNSFRNAIGYKLQAGYDFVGALKGASLNFRYTDYKLDSKYSKLNGAPQDEMKLYGAQLKYGFLKNGYFAATYEQGNLSGVPTFHGLRLIGGYKF